MPALINPNGGLTSIESCNFAAMQVETKKPLKFQKTLIPYGETGFFGKLILDYLNDDSFLKPFYNRRPELGSFEAQMAEKGKSYRHRESLVSALNGQYSRAKLPVKNISALDDENAFTITTGHQVCLFTGPLYFIYKIVSVINTCRQLQEKHPSHSFVPVFWMATEDHDFEEANHFITPKGKIEWESGQGGAVGQMNTVGMDEVLESIKAVLGIGYRSAELYKLFENAYVKHDNIADATRYLVHQLFGKYGVVVIDGDDAALKSIATPLFEREVLEELSCNKVIETSSRLKEKYKQQVTPRKLNLFYLDDEFRDRLVKTDEGVYEVLHSSISFSEEELLKAMKSNPDQFSPNVILRPLYQEAILPNLAYIGGGGELAYWFQLKDMFDAFEIPFPVLMLRNSAGLLSEEDVQAMKSQGYDYSDLFSSSLEMKNELVESEEGDDFSLDKEWVAMEVIFAELESKLGDMDTTLRESVKSGEARTARIVSNLEKKWKRAARRKHENAIEKFEKLKSDFIVNGGLQERVYNYSYGYLAFGDGLIDELLANLDPFDFRFSVLSEA